VGKHTAVEGASADPIVADALASRATGAGGVHHADSARAEGESGLGWPAPPAPGGGGLGWPADATDALSESAPPVARRGWRRLFGLSRVA
jgi:hypothetical protein